MFTELYIVANLYLNASSKGNREGCGTCERGDSLQDSHNSCSVVAEKKVKGLECTRQMLCGGTTGTWGAARGRESSDFLDLGLWGLEDREDRFFAGFFAVFFLGGFSLIFKYRVGVKCHYRSSYSYSLATIASSAE